MSTAYEKISEHLKQVDSAHDDTLSGIASDLWSSFKVSATQPIRAGAEAIDRIAGTKLEESVKIDGPAQAEIHEGRYWAQQVGNAAGMLPWFLLVHKGVGAGMTRTLGKEVMAGSAATQLELARTAASGFIFGAGLSTSGVGAEASAWDFAGKKLTNGIHQAASFTLMEGAGMAVGSKFGARSAAEKIGASFTGGLLGGAADAELNALRNGHLLATSKEFGHSMITFGLVGAGMTSIHSFVPKLKESPSFGEKRGAASTSASEGNLAGAGMQPVNPFAGDWLSRPAAKPVVGLTSDLLVSSSAVSPVRVAETSPLRPSGEPLTVRVGEGGRAASVTIPPEARMDITASTSPASAGGAGRDTAAPQKGFATASRGREAGAGVVLDGLTVRDGAPGGEPTFADRFNDTHLRLVQVREMATKIANNNGVGIRRTDGGGFQINFTDRGDVNGLTIPRGAQSEQVSQVVATASYARLIADDGAAMNAASRGVRSAIGFGERTIESKVDWETTKKNAVEGSAAYVRGDKGNNYTAYLRERFGEFGLEDRASLGQVIEQSADRHVIPHAVSGIPISPEARGAALNPAIESMRPSARKQAVNAVLRAALHDPRMAGVDANTTAGGIKLGEIARTMPEPIVQAAIAIDKVAGPGRGSLAPDELKMIADLQSETGKSVQSVYAQLNGAAGSVAARITGLPDMASARSVRDVRTLIERTYQSEPARAEQVFSSVMAQTADLVRGANAHGIGGLLVNAKSAGTLDGFVWLRNPRGTEPAGPVVERLRAVGAVVKNLGAHEFTPERAQAVLQVAENGAPGFAGSGIGHANDIVIADRLMQSGFTNPTPVEVEVARSLMPEIGQGRGEISIEDGTKIYEVTEAIRAAGLSASDAPVVSCLLETGVRVNPMNLEIAKRLSQESTGFSPELMRLEAEIAAGAGTGAADAHRIVNSLINEIARLDGINLKNVDNGPMLAELRRTHPTIDPANLKGIMADLQREGGFTIRQLSNPEVFRLAYEAKPATPAASVRLQSIATAERIHGINAIWNNNVLKTYEAVIEAGMEPSEITVKHYQAARALMEYRKSCVVPPAADVQPTKSVLEAIIRNPGFDLARSQPRIDSSIWDELSHLHH